jgi:hypothetical protein
MITALVPLLLLIQSPGDWECRAFAHGDGVFTFAIRESLPLAVYTNGLYVPHPSLRSKVWRPGEGPIRAEVHTVGRIGGLDALDVFYREEKQDKIKAKALLVGRDGLFRPLLWLFHDGSLSLTPSRITTVQGHSILMSRTRESGSGHLWIEDYFLFDEPVGLVNLRVLDRIGEELDRLLPLRQRVRKGGGFDIETLSFAHAVWNEGDSNGGPTGGQVFLKFRIAAGRLELESASVEPAAQ